MSKRKTPPATTGTTGTTGTTTGTGQTGNTHKKPAKPPAPSALAAPLVRNMNDSVLAGLNLRGDHLEVALAASPDLFGQTSLKLGRTALLLPRDVLTPATRPIFARLQWDGQDTFTRKTAYP